MSDEMSFFVVDFGGGPSNPSQPHSPVADSGDRWGDALAQRTVDVTVVAMDPSVRDQSGRILSTTVPVTADRLGPGPRSHRFFVVDYNTTKQTANPPAVLTDGEPAGWRWVDAYSAAPDDVLETDPSFRAQNVWAVAANTLDRFERALGRRVPWAFNGHHLHLVPTAFEEANAYYSPEDRAVLFGYIDRGDSVPPVHTSLARDVVAHEVTHAILDGLRPRLASPGLPDQAAFHEGFADIVALLSILSAKEVIVAALGPPNDEGRIPADAISSQSLREGVLLGVAKQLGSTMSGGRASALRRSVELDPNPDLLADPQYQEAHNRGEILVAAFAHTLLEMWSDRLEAITYGGGLDLDRAAEEGAKAAGHLLEMAIRAVDYTPPVELEFGDYIDAVLLSDQIVAPDDRHQYRDALTGAFAGFGITPPERRIIDVDSQADRPLYNKLNLDALRVDRDEVFRFLWQNASFFDIDTDHYLQVERVRHATRVGPDGLVLTEILADYIQLAQTTVGELCDRLNIDIGPDGNIEVDAQTPVQILGGGVVIFDQFGKARYHQTKPIGDPNRQRRRLMHLLGRGLADSRQRFGFSYGERHGQRFSALHASAHRSGEAW